MVDHTNTFHVGLYIQMLAYIGNIYSDSSDRKQPLCTDDKMVNALHAYSALLTSGHSKRFTILPKIHPFTHTFTQRRRSEPCRATTSSPGAVRVRVLVLGLNPQLGGAGDRTNNLTVTSRPALPPEPHAAPNNGTALLLYYELL